MAQELGTVYNATGVPQIVDSVGRVVGAAEFGVAPVNEQPAKALLEAGQLVTVTIPADGDVAPGARAAADELAARSKPAKATAAKASPTPPTPTTEA